MPSANKFSIRTERGHGPAPAEPITGQDHGVVPMRPPIDSGTISARLDRLPDSRVIWRLIAVLSLGLFFEVYDMLFTGYVAPGLVKAGILTTTTTTLFGMTGVAGFIAALFLGLFIGTISCGVLADRFGRKTIFTYSLLWYAAANTIMATQSSAGALIGWRFVSGMGIGVQLITIGSYISELAPKHIRGKAFAISQAIGLTAVPIVAYLSYLLIPIAPFGIAGWRWVVLAGGSGALLVWWFQRFLIESPRWLSSRGRLSEADLILTELESKIEREQKKALPPPEPALEVARRGAFRDMWRPPYRTRTIMLIIFHVFQTVGFYGFANWVPTLLVKQGITVASSLLYTSAIGLAAPIGPLLGFWFADRLERKHVIVAMAGANVVCGLIFGRLSAPAAIVLVGVCLTLTNNIISFTYHAYQQELYPTDIRARAVGFVYSWSRMSAVFSSFIIAFFLKDFGVIGAFSFIAGAMVVVMVTIGMFGPRTKGASLESISN